ncbi:hypothetical protein GQ55_1G178700 [Panicum hallii var. hallii]|uniref:Uncharacterized protein n=1 Tax=Panicum hallii var. hallii TaxID=1504633 RepID=A0A2T7F606_9POAL|nr:hypothetical protein GQ55_1G178700 [Panicum hallii var. hallii]
MTPSSARAADRRSGRCRPSEKGAARERGEAYGASQTLEGRRRRRLSVRLRLSVATPFVHAAASHLRRLGHARCPRRRVWSQLMNSMSL